VVGEGACRSGKALPCRSKASGSCNEPQADCDLCMHIARRSAEVCVCSTPSMAPWRLGPDWCCGHEVGEALKPTKAPRHARTSKHRRIAPFFGTSNLHTSGQNLSPPPPRCRQGLDIPSITSVIRMEAAPALRSGFAHSAPDVPASWV
jgi:hypothetical protein